MAVYSSDFLRTVLLSLLRAHVKQKRNVKVDFFVCFLPLSENLCAQHLE